MVFDIGGTFTKWAFLDENFSHVERGEFVSFDNDEDDKIEQLYIKICNFINKHKNRIVGIGISAACIVDVETGTFLSENTTFRGYTGFRAKDFIKNRTGFDPIIINDANSGALGEVEFGALKGTKNAVMIVIGTGVGAGIVIDGKPYNGNAGGAGEVGFLIIEKQRFEEICSARALTNAISNELGKGVDGRWVFNNKDNSIVKKHYHQFLDRLAQGIASIWNVLSPEKIIISGGITQEESFDLEELKEHIKEYTLESTFNRMELGKAILGNGANLMGVATLVKEKLKN